MLITEPYTIPTDLLAALLAVEIDPADVAVFELDGSMCIEIQDGQLWIGSEDTEDGGIYWMVTATYDDGSETLAYDGTDVHALAAALKRRGA